MSRACFLFVHGWGFDARIWNPLRALLPEAEHLVWEAGYLGAPAARPAPPPGAVAVGHSAGVMTLLQAVPAGLSGLVSINGFTRFTTSEDFRHGTPVRLVERMCVRLRRDPVATLDAFRARCGVPVPKPEALDALVLDAEALQSGLLALRDDDGRAALRGLGLELLALYSDVDPIVPAEMTADCFPSNIMACHPGGGHLLPLSDPAWCAAHLRRFVGA